MPLLPLPADRPPRREERPGRCWPGRPCEQVGQPEVPLSARGAAERAKRIALARPTEPGKTLRGGQAYRASCTRDCRPARLDECPSPSAAAVHWLVCSAAARLDCKPGHVKTPLQRNANTLELYRVGVPCYPRELLPTKRNLNSTTLALRLGKKCECICILFHFVIILYSSTEVGI